MEKKIGFRELSGWMKTAVILTWIMGGIFCLSFLVGFIAEIIG